MMLFITENIMKSTRMSRVDSEIQKHIQKIISNFDDAEIANSIISVMKVETFADFSCSKIFISMLGSMESKKRIVKKLNDNKKTIRYRLAHEMKFRTVPDLIFVVDDTDERAENVLRLFEQIEKDMPKDILSKDNSNSENTDDEN